MKKLNIKPNLRQFLTDKIKTQKNNPQNNPESNSSYHFVKQINSNININKNIGKYSLLNSLKGKDTKKITKLIVHNNLKNIKIPNNNFHNNNSLLKEIQNDCNNFRKSKTSDKISSNKTNLLIGYQENQTNNNNKKIMIKQNNIKKYNLSLSNIPKYDNSAFKQAMKYYTIKSESRTIQIEELSTYLRPIRNILGLNNNNKTKTQNNINSSINIHNHCNFKENNILNNNKENIYEEIKNNSENRNNNIIYNSINSIEHDINHDDNINDLNQDNNNNDIKDYKNKKTETFEKHLNFKSCSNLTKKNELNDDNNIKNNSLNTINNNINIVNTSLVKNCVFNNNIPYTQRNNKISQIPFCIKIDKIDNTNKDININGNYKYKNKTSINNNKNTNNNIINSKNVSEIETQISTNNNLNNANQDINSQKSQSQTLYQFRPRKMHLPKTGINLSSMPFKNQILQNILNKRKQNK